MANEKPKLNEFWTKLGIPTCTLSEARQAIVDSFETRTPVCVVGEAGIGKSQITKQIAKDLNMKYHVYFAAHNEREDIIGVPFPDKSGKYYSFLVEKSIQELIDDDRPTLLVFDEWNRGDKAVMNAIFTVMEDRRLGSQKLPDNVHIVACMNPSEDSYNVNEAEKDPAFRRRLTFLAVQANEVVWIEHANKAGFHPAVIDFVRAKPAMLNDTMTREAGKVYANPAGWEKVSNVLKAMESQGEQINSGAIRRRLYITLAGIVGVGVSNDFLNFIEDNYSFVTPQQILNDYHNVKNKITAWTKSGAAGINRLQQTFESLALYMATENIVLDDTSDGLVDNLVAFLGDLPKDLQALQQFFTKLAKYMNEATATATRTEFLNTLSAKMSVHKGWKKLLKDSRESVEKVRDEQAKALLEKSSQPTS